MSHYYLQRRRELQNHTSHHEGTKDTKKTEVKDFRRKCAEVEKESSSKLEFVSLCPFPFRPFLFFFVSLRVLRAFVVRFSAAEKGIIWG